MPRVVSEFSPSEVEMLNDLKARHDAEEAKKARKARHDAEKHVERRKTVEKAPAKEQALANSEGDRIRREPSKVKDPRRSDKVRQSDSVSKDEERARQLGKDIDAARRLTRKESEIHRQSSKGADAAQRLTKELEKPRHSSSKSQEKHDRPKEKAKEPSRHGSNKAPSSQSMSRAATGAQRPARRSNGASSLERTSTVPDEPRVPLPAADMVIQQSLVKRSSTTIALPPQPQASSKGTSQGMARIPPPRKLSTVTEMPGSFSSESTEVTELVVSDLPRETPVAPPVAEAPRALFHINGPLVNLNFNLWGK